MVHLLKTLFYLTSIIVLSAWAQVYASSNTEQSSLIIFNKKTIGSSAQLMAIWNESNVEVLSPQIHWRDLEPSYSQITGDIIFSSNRRDSVTVDLNKQHDTFSLFLLNPRSGSVKPISGKRGTSSSTLNAEHDLQPKFHLDKEIIAFIRAKGQVEQSLVVKDLTRNVERTIVTGKQIHDFSWRPNTNTLLISVETAKTYQLNEYAIDGTQIRTMFDFRKSDPLAFIPLSIRSSPKGNHIAYIQHPTKKGAERALWLLDLKSNEHTKIQFGHEQVQAPINWSPKGDALVFAGLVNYRFYYDEKKMKKVYEGGMHLFYHELGQKTRLLTREDTFHGKPRFSPDGKRLAFLYAKQLGDAPMYQLHTMSVDGKDRKILHERVSRQSSLLWVAVDKHEKIRVALTD